MRTLLVVRADPDAVGGASTEGSVCFGTTLHVQFEGFNLFGATAYAIVTDSEGEYQTDAAAVTNYGAGAAGVADIDFGDGRLQILLGDNSKCRCRIALYTETDGWLGFAEITLHKMPPVPEVLGS